MKRFLLTLAALLISAPALAQTTAERKANLHAFIDSRTDTQTLQVEDALVPLGYVKLSTPPPEPPPVDVTYGPRFTPGQKDRQYRDEVGADGKTRLVEVSIPLSAITINVGDNWQTKINAGTTGTVFRIKAGTHTRQSITPKNGQEFWGEPGAIVDGQGTSGSFPRGSATNVLLKNLKIKSYATGAEEGMVGNSSMKTLRVEDCEISNSTGFLIRVGTHVKRCSLHDGGNGIVSSYYTEKSLLEDCEIFRAKVNGDSSRTAKYWNSKGAIIRYCHLHDVDTHSLWFDANNFGYEIHNCLFENIGRNAVYIEISYGGKVHHCKIRRTNLINNGYAGIRTQNSQNVEMFENDIAECAIGIQMASSAQQNDGATMGNWVGKNNFAHHNRFAQCVKNVEVVNWGDPNNPFTPSANNKADFNQYKGGNFGWQGTKNWTQWRAIPQDANGSYQP